MKKKRRIEITSFSRRTTIGVNPQEDVNDAKQPDYRRDISSQQVPSEQPSAKEPELNKQPSGVPVLVTTREQKGSK
jgi:hypothetical protein